MADVEQNFGSGLLGYVMLMDPSTGKPYKAQNVVQQTDGEFNTQGLATSDMQERELAAINAVAAKLSGPLTVEMDAPEMPLPAGAATDAKQDSMITALGNLAALLGGTLNVSVGGQPLQAQITSTTLPTGAATSANQEDVKTALNAVLTALAGVLEVSGDVSVSSDEPLEVVGTVHMDNTTLSVTPSGTFNVSVTGGATAAKQDSVITALQDVLTRLSNPLPVSDGGGSITVDGVVGVSGSVPVTDNGGSLTVDGTVGATQSGTWNVGLTGTPTVNVGNTVTISDGSGPLTVDGSVSATITGTPNVNVTNTSLPVNVGNTVNVSDGNGSLTVDGAVSATVTNTSIPVTQSGTWNVGVNGTVPVSVAATLPVSLASVPTHAVTQSGAWTQTPTAAATLTTTPTAVAVGTTSVSLVASQSGRRSLMVQNMGGTTLMLSFAATADPAAPTFQVPAGGWIVIDRETWTGAVTAIRASGSATSNAIVTVTS